MKGESMSDHFDSDKVEQCVDKLTIALSATLSDSRNGMDRFELNGRETLAVISKATQYLCALTWGGLNGLTEEESDKMCLEIGAVMAKYIRLPPA